jgi:hypothetical protein
MISIGILFLLIFLSGFRLSVSGKPYSGVLFNVHKLIALGTVLLIGYLVYQTQQTAPLQTLQIAATAVTVLFFVITIIGGGLASLDQGIPPIFLRVHQITPYLTLFSSAVTLYLLRV